MMAARAKPLDLDGVIDAEFETVLPTGKIAAVVARPAILPSTPDFVSDSLALLRGGQKESARTDQPDQLTPTFLLFTFLAAAVVFWVSGGRALLY